MRVKGGIACLALLAACSKPGPRASSRSVSRAVAPSTAEATEGTDARAGTAGPTEGDVGTGAAEAPRGVAQPPAPAPFHPPAHRAPGFLAKGGGGISLGISRNALVAKLGNCAHRVGPSSDEPGVHRVEIFRPEGKRCEERFGKLSYFVVDGYLEQIVATQLPSARDTTAPGPEQRDSRTR